MNYRIIRYCKLCKKKFFGTTGKYVEQYCVDCTSKNEKAKKKEELA
jgi:hypothetical protein